VDPILPKEQNKDHLKAFKNQQDAMWDSPVKEIGDKGDDSE